MKNRTYWASRQRMLEEARHKQNTDHLRQLDKAFTVERRNIENQILSWYERLADNNGVSLAEAKRMLSAKELKEFRWTVEDYIKYGQENAIGQQWLKELENASAKAHIERLQALEIELGQKVESIYHEYGMGVTMLISGQMKDLYAEASKISGVDLAFDTRKVKSVLSKPWTSDGKTFSERIWGRKNELHRYLHTELTRMCITGETPKRVIKNLSEKFGVEIRHAKTLVHTESAYFHSVTQKRIYEELDVEKYEILAEIDGKTSEICLELNGHVFDAKDFEPGVTAPPFHPNCRTITVPWFPDEEERIEKNSKRGYNKTSGGVSGAITDTYSEAAKKHAKIRYNAIRKQKHDVRKIATNTGYTEEIIQEIKNYLFIDEHNLGDRIARFDPDFAIAHSWDRLSQGVFEPHDLTLLKHEIMERQLIREGLTQHEAHIQTSKKYNYQKEAAEYYAELKKRQKRG